MIMILVIKSSFETEGEVLTLMNADTLCTHRGVVLASVCGGEQLSE